MKITSQLALSQLKLNRKRTSASVLAIALSASLVTAVMCFVTSGNKMLIDFLGPGYGEYGGAYSVMIAVPALILGLLIAMMSVTVISNIFAASANKRIQEFGILKCIGGTGKQIRETVIYESLWLCVIGIPLGLVLGTVIGFLGVRITGHFVKDINELSKSIIMRPFSFSLPFSVSVWTYVLAAVFSFLIVIWSARKPAKAVGKLTAIQCVKDISADAGFRQIDVKDGLVGKLFGSEGAIAYKNIKRNRAGYQATTRALSLGILLLLMTGGLAGQAKEFQEWMTPASNEMMVDYCSIRDKGIHPDTGREEEKIVAPISSEAYHEITEKLSAYGNLEVYGVGEDACTYRAILNPDSLTEEMGKVPDILDANGEARVLLITVDEKLYQKLCERADAPYGSNLLINIYQYNDGGRMKEIKPFRENTAEITMITAAEEKQVFKVGGVLYQDDLIEQGFRDLMPDPVRMIVPNIDARAFSWFCTPDDEQAYTEYAREVLDEYYPILTEDSYVEQGYTVRISRTDTMVKVLNIAIVLAEVVMYGFVILLILMGFTSVISTLAANIRIRSREFAILKSIGMTNSSLRKMIDCESIICIARASVSGILLGIAIPFAVNLSIRNAFPVLYHIPWGMLVVGIMILTGIVLLITRVETNKLNNQSIISEIRMDTM